MRRIPTFKAAPIKSAAPKVTPAGLSTPSIPGMPKPKAMAGAPHERFTPRKSAATKGAFGTGAAPGDMAFPSEPGSLPGAGS